MLWRQVCPMREDQHRFLTLLGQLPARLTAEHAAWALNCQAHDVPIQVATRILTPLINGVKFFSPAVVLALTRDRAWLFKMTNSVCQHWQRQNVKRKSRSVSVSPSGQSQVVSLAAAG